MPATRVNAIWATVGLTAGGPHPTVKAFARKHLAQHKLSGDHNGPKGYPPVYVARSASERIGKFDSKALAAALHGAKFYAKDNPGVLLDVPFDQSAILIERASSLKS